MNIKKFESNEIPGMIEPIEQALLSKLAETVNFSGGRQAVEFGTFFGRSTMCIADGMSRNSTLDNTHLHAYDSFSCDRLSGFINHVQAFAKIGEVQSLLITEGNKVSFLPIFLRYLKSHIDSGLLRTYSQELRASRAPQGQIALMHIDSPKFYQEFKTILFRFFPACVPGCAIVFQDYFYHWSASLIAVIELLHDSGLIEFGPSAASSLSATLIKVPSLEALMEIDLHMQSRQQINDLLAVAEVNSVRRCTDRAKIFAPRVHLAEIQYVFESGDTAKAGLSFQKFLAKNSPVPNQLLNDFLELFSNGFSVRAQYVQDYD